MIISLHMMGEIDKSGVWVVEGVKRKEKTARRRLRMGD